MARKTQRFLCTACGAIQARWMGKCPDCGAWDSLEEHAGGEDPHKGVAGGVAAGWIEAGGSVAVEAGPRAVPMAEATPDARTPRVSSGIGELDRVLGGDERGVQGLVPGSAVLIGGEPGIGKSTLLLQAAASWARSARAAGGCSVLYASSEESTEQVARRAARLGASDVDGLYVLADTNLARIAEQARQTKPAVLVIDSVQMVYKPDLDAAPGSVAQLRRCGAELVYLAKASGTAVVMVGHVTKEGALAGPRVLEHLVDAVLYFEGDRFHTGRIVRAIKNRFGTTMELGIFEMGSEGLVEAPGGASAHAESESRPGSAVCAAMLGSRCVTVEVQALTATGFVGAAKRKSSGLDTSRLAMIIAVLEQHGGLRLADRDVFVSAVGGLRVTEPACDLALALAIAGAQHRTGLLAGTVVVGEVGLGGEVRPVPQMETRLREAARLGFGHAIVAGGARPPRVQGLAIDSVRSVPEALERLSKGRDR